MANMCLEIKCITRLLLLECGLVGAEVASWVTTDNIG